MPPGPIEGPPAWRGAEMRTSDEWVHVFSTAEIAELEFALDEAKARGLDLIDIGRTTFPLPTLGPVLDAIHREIVTGRGFVLLQGLPVENWSIERAAGIYWGIGTYFGKPVSQNAKGHLLGHVKDLGYALDDPKVRTYQTTERQYFHTDSCDIVALLCLKPAMRGGLSSIASSVTVFNEMHRQRPDLAALLFEPLAYDRRGEVPEGEKGYYQVSPFSWFGGYLTTVFVRRYIDSAQRFDDVDNLSEQQIDALDLFEALAEDEDIRIDMEFRPGDIQLLNNHQILHDRTEFEDWPDPEHKRHLLRLWLCPEDGRPLPESYAQRYGGSVAIGDRGGIRTPGQTLRVPLEAE